jgi:site-specific recombinase XerD
MKNLTSYLQAKNLSNTTQTAYQRHVNLFLEWHTKEPQNTTKKDILNYLSYLQTNKNQANITRKNALISLKHYFDFLDFDANPTTFLTIRGTKKKHLYKTYTAEELTQIYDNFYHTFIRTFDDKNIPKNQQEQSYLSRNRNFAIIGFLLFNGLNTNEIQNIALKDLDLIQAKVTIKSTSKSCARTLNLSAQQIGSLMNYLQNIRPKFLSYQQDRESQNLFLPLPEAGRSRTEKTNLMGIFKQLSKNMAEIQKDFQKFKQIRASVITNWLKTEGLRKTQYLAGHRYISSTEHYQPNDLEALTDEIEKFNPF